MLRTRSHARGAVLAVALLALLAPLFTQLAAPAPASAQTTVPSNWIKGLRHDRLRARPVQDHQRARIAG